jgi:RHS repeat-associated protein
MDGPYSQGYDYDVWGNVTHKYGWGGEVQGGTAGQNGPDINRSYTNNRVNGFSYDAAGNLTNDLGQTFTYDATGQQATASYGGYSLTQSYDGDGLRVKKNDNGAQTYYLHSSVLGGQVVAEIIWASVSWQWNRGYVYLGSQLLAVQQAGVYWMHEDPVTKSKRVTNSAGAIVSTIETDPWGADTNRSSNGAFQPKKFTTYERDANGTDEAMFRRYNRWQSRFDQPDPYDGSYSLTNPQSFNRYAYVQGDPVNLIDPSGLDEDCVMIDGELVCFDPKDTVHTYTWAPSWQDLPWLRDYPAIALFFPAAGDGPTGGNPTIVPHPQNPGPLPQSPANGEYTCSTIGAGVASIGAIVDANNQAFPTFGLGYSTGPTVPGLPNLSYTQTRGSGPVSPGIYLTGTASSGLTVSHSVNVFTGQTGREVGYGTPNYGAGVQVVLPALQGTTPWDWAHHRDNPLAKHRFLSPVGRCVD